MMMNTAYDSMSGGGHYGSDRAALEQDFLDRVEDYQRQFSVKVAQVEAPGIYKYYSTQRPVDIGTFPQACGQRAG